MELNREQSDKFKKFLKDKLPTNRKNSWFENLQLLKITTSNVIFGGITHRVYRYEIKTNHEFLLVKVLDELFPEYSPFSSKIFVYNIGVVKENKKSIQAEFDFNITNIGKKIKKPYIKKENSLKNKNTAFNYNYNHFFSSFIPGERNLLAIRSSKVVVEMPGIAFNPFVIYGESGSGKTHLLEAINNESHKINSKLSSVNVSTEDFLNDFINHLRTNKMKDFRDLYRKADIFLLDDLESILPSKKCQNELLHTIKTLRKKNHRLLLHAKNLQHI